MVPLALGAAVSPVLLTLSILLLSSDFHPRVRVLAYAGGVFISLVVIGVVAVGGSATGGDGPSHPSTVSAGLDILLGILLIAVAVKNSVGSPKAAEKKPAKAPKAEPSLAVQVVRDAGLGLFLTVTNFSSLIFYLAAAKSTADSHLPALDQAAAMSLVGFGFMAPIVLPLLATVASPAASKKFLDATNRVVKDYGRYIGAAVALLFGVYLILKGAKVFM